MMCFPIPHTVLSRFTLLAAGLLACTLSLSAARRAAVEQPDFTRGLYLTAYAMPLKAIRLTGSQPTGIPQLEQLKIDLSNHREARALRPRFERTEELIETIGSASEKVELRHLDFNA